MGYKLKGVVSCGRRLGRRLGFPTANIPMSGDMPVADGVYAARVEIDGRAYNAMVNAGHRPSVENDGSKILEAHIFDFEGDLYGKEIEVELLQFMRSEEKFGTLEELKRAVDLDRSNILKYFNN